MGGKMYFKPKQLAWVLSMAAILVFFSSHVVHSSNDFTENMRASGHLTQRVSMNMENPPETDGDDRYNLSMFRSTAYLELNGYYDLFDFGVVGRIDREYKTEYLRELDRMSNADLESFYDDAEFREYYVDIEPWDNVQMRLGKQQVVWGRTDFFQAMDVIHGYDFSWRTFLEAENQYLRKPLTMANAQVRMPGGQLQLIWIPGDDINSEDQYGNTYDLRGGRWALQPNKGFDFLTGGVPYNYHHSEGDSDDDHYGVRWTGMTGPVEYSLAYFYGNRQDPVLNSAADPYEGEAPQNEFAEFIFPKEHMIGGTMNYYFRPLDMVLRTELAYIFDRTYNVGQDASEVFAGIPGFDGIEEYDTVRSMIGFDKPMSWVKPLLGARKDGFFSMQLFTTTLLDYDRGKDEDNIVRLAGYGAGHYEYDSILTGILGWNYAGDTVNPQLAGGVQVNNGDFFVIPSCQFVLSDRLRLYTEYAMFFPGSNYKEPGEVETDTQLIGWFENNDQLYVRLKYVF